MKLTITNSFVAHTKATEDAPARDIQVFITDNILDYKDRAVLKHLVNSNVDITKLATTEQAHELAEQLDSMHKLVTSQKDVNIRCKKWSLAKKSDSTSDCDPCEDPSIGPDHIYNDALVKKITNKVISMCKTRKYQSFISFEMLHECVATAIYGTATQTFDKHQLAVIKFAEERFANRYCVISPFNQKGYNLGTELMSTMFPEGVLYRAQKYVKYLAKGKKTYFIITADKIVNVQTGKATAIPASTPSERNEIRLKLDNTLYYSKKA